MYTDVCALEEIKNGKMLTVNAGSKEIALINSGGHLYAIDNACKHRGGPLAEGELDGMTVTCSWHGWQFDIATGACHTMPGVTAARYPVKVENGRVLIDV